MFRYGFNCILYKRRRYGRRRNKRIKESPENVTREEFDELLEKVNNISIKYNF